MTAGTSGSGETSDSIQLQTVHGAASAYVAAPAAPPWGGLVLIQEIFGVNAHIREVARTWAALGLKVLAPRLFDFVQPGRELDYDESGKWLTLRFVIDEGPRYVVRNVSVLGNEKFDTETLRNELYSLCLDWAEKHPDLGFCIFYYEH